jgi:hypothetical protein
MSDRFDEKLDEAAYFLERMRFEERGSDHRTFRWNLGAFLSAVRCVQQYIRKAAVHSNLAQVAAYDELASKEPLLKCFRELRNLDIHEAPVRPTSLFTIAGFVPSSPPDPNGRPQPPGFKFWFDNWQGPGPGEVLDACDRYLRALRKLLDDAEGAGILTR